MESVTTSPCCSVGRAADSLERRGDGSIPSKDAYRKEKMIHDIKVFNPKGKLLKVINGQKQMDLHYSAIAKSIAQSDWGIAANKHKKNIICSICKKEVEGTGNQITCKSAKCLRERVKTRLRYVTSRKDKQSLPYIYKVICKECGKTEMKQTIKAKYCSKKCANTFTGRINRKKNREMRISIGGTC